MDQIHKDALRRTRVAIVRDLDVDHICDDVLEKDIFTQLMMEYIMAERTRIDKVRRLLDDLVRRGPNAYQAFLQVLDTTGYQHLAQQIRQNECVLRRQKEPNTSIPVQATNEGYSAIHLPSTSSGFPSHLKAGNLNYNARNTTAEPTTSHPSFEPNSLSLGSSTTNVSSTNTSSLASTSTSETGSLSVTGMELSGPTESADDDTLDLLESLNPSSMDVDEQETPIDPNTEEALLRDSDNQQNEGVSMQPTDTSNASYSLGPPMTMQSFYHQSRSLDKCYIMESTPRGVVLIINNKDFERNQTERAGTEHDCKKLKDLFESLSFKVIVKENLTSGNMLKEFHTFANHSDLENADCLVLAVLSHGTGENYICGVDGRGIHVMDILTKIFSAKKCPKMRGKPKMFIFNACRGDKNGESIEIENTLNLSSTIQRDELQRDGPNSVSTDRQVLDTQDLLLCFSTFPGYSSYRDTNEGSWFIQEFVSVFEEQAHSEHVMDMLTEINRKVSQKKHRESMSETCVQMPFPSSSLTKKWFINPPQLGATSLAY